MRSVEVKHVPRKDVDLVDANLPRSERSVDRWFDPSAFRVAAPFTFGNCGRNVLRGPGFVNLDLLLGRELRVGRDRRLEFRVEIFNAANAVHLGAPNTVIDVPAQAGRITSTQAPAQRARCRQVRLLIPLHSGRRGQRLICP